MRSNYKHRRSGANVEQGSKFCLANFNSLLEIALSHLTVNQTIINWTPSTVARGPIGKCSWLLGVAFGLCAQVVFGQATEKAAPVHDLDGSFVREWLVLGPIPSRNREADFLVAAGGEAKVRPKAGEAVEIKDGKPLVWTRLSSKHDAIDLEQVSGPLGRGVFYAYCEVNSGQSAEMDARIATLHPGAVWFNGEKVAWTPLGLTPDLPPVAHIRVAAGRNSCLLKLAFESDPQYSFAFQPLPPEQSTAEFSVTDSEARPVANAVIQIHEQGEQVGRLTTDTYGKAVACLYPPARSYDIGVAGAESGTWLRGVSFRPGERRRLDLVLGKAISISGHVLALDGSPQIGIVVQALPVSDESSATTGERPSRPLYPGFATGPQINGASDAWGWTREKTPPSSGRIRSVLSTPPFSKSALSDADGNFKFVNLHPGRYRLRAHGLRGYVYPEGVKGPEPAGVIEVGPGRTHDGVQFIFAEAKKGSARSYPIKKGLVDVSPSTLQRTADGMVWIGTFQRSLHTFDGVSATIFPGELPGSYVRALANDATGTLWVATEKGIRRVVSGQLQTAPFGDSLAGQDVGAILAEPTGTLWFGTTAGLWKYDGQSLLRWTVKEGLPGNEIGALLRTRDGALWMSTARSLTRYDGQNFAEPILFSGLRESSRDKLYQARDGALWYCSPNHEQGAYRFDGKTLAHLGVDDGLADEHVWDFAETSDGALWLATDKGVSKFDGTTILNYTTADGLGWGGVAAILADPDDAIWCSSFTNFSKLDTKSFVGINKRDGLIMAANYYRETSTASVFAIEPDSQHGFWLGTEWGGVYRLESDARDRLTKADFLATNYVRQIQRTADGAIWLGTAGGIFKYSQGRAERVLERHWIIAMQMDDQGQLWFGEGWMGGGLSRYNPKTGALSQFTRADGLPDDSVWALAPDAGRVWIGTAGGLAEFRDGKIERIGEQLHIPSGAVNGLRRDEGGALWIGGYTGLHRLQGTNLLSLMPTNGVPLESVWCSAQTADGVLWIGTDKDGLLGYDGQAMTRLDKRDGLAGNQVFALRVDVDDSLLVGCIGDGLSRYRRTKTPPSIRLSEVKLEDRTLSEFTNVPTTEIGRRVSIRYQEIDQKTLPDKRQFKYVVKGPSGQTVFAGVTKDRHFDWTPRKGGAYTFEVQAIDRDLNYSKPARLAFRATVPWYANAWITVPGGSLFGGLTVWAFVGSAIYLRQRREAAELRDQLLLQERKARGAMEEKALQLEKAMVAAEAANHAKSAFLANMSHEIRTPLNAIMGYAQILRRKPGLPADERAAVNTIEASGDHLLTLIDSVLDLSKIEAGSMELQPADFDLTQLIQEVSAMFLIRCAEKRLEWQVRFENQSSSFQFASEEVDDGDLPSAKGDEEGARSKSPAPPLPSSIPVRGDKGKLRQVLLNLLGNAVKFTDRGQVTLRVVAAEHHPGATFTFEIIDSGPGVPARSRDSLFAPFVQVGDGVKKGGTGLGLAISKRLVELMGGTIGLRPAGEAGSVFFFAVPLTPAADRLGEQVPLDEREPTRLAANSKVDALVVDDVDQNREVLSQILVSLGCQVRVAESGARALELIRSGIPDIVFTDIRMPQMGGLELKKAILDEFGAGRIRIVAISASVLAHQQKAYLDDGFDDFVAKPFRVARIAACLTHLLLVDFEYETPPKASVIPKAGSRAESPRVLLPESLRSRLRAAAKSYRIVELKRCLAEVEQLGAEGRRLAEALAVLNEKGNMERILEMLDRLG